MISVKVNLPKRLNLPGKEEMINRALTALGAYAVASLTKKAQESLSPLTAQTYIQGLQQPSSVTIERNVLTVTLVGALPNALEQGAGPFDIKRAMLAKATKRSVKGIPYVDVPFEHGIPGTTGRRPMPTSEYEIMKKAIAASATKSKARGPKSMPTKAETRTVRVPGAERSVAYAPKRGPYDDMIHLAKRTKGGAKEGRYLTIRRISAASDPASWIHPGFKAIRLFQDVENDIKGIAPKVIHDYVTKLP